MLLTTILPSRHDCRNQVAEAKKRVEAKSAIPPAQQRLIFAGKAM